MTPSWISATIAFSALSVVCAGPRVSDVDVNAIHNVVLGYHFEKDDWGQNGESLLVLSNRLAVPEGDRGVPKEDPSRTVCLRQHYPPPGAVADYEQKAKLSRPLDGNFRLKIEHRLLDADRWHQILTEEGGWTGFESIFPGASRFVQLSDVGFDTSGRSAIVYIADYPKTALLYVLRKEGEEWRIVDGCMLWVS